MIVSQADWNGRVTISRLENKKVYIVNLGSGYFVTEYKELAEEVSKKADIEDFGMTLESANKR